MLSGNWAASKRPLRFKVAGVCERLVYRTRPACTMVITLHGYVRAGS